MKEIRIYKSDRGGSCERNMDIDDADGSVVGSDEYWSGASGKWLVKNGELVRPVTREEIAFGAFLQTELVSDEEAFSMVGKDRNEPRRIDNT